MTTLLPFLCALLDAGASVYEVGGMVRDGFLGRERDDHDYLVRHLPVDIIVRILSPFGTVSCVGKSFGVIKLSPYSHRASTIDFVLPRKEHSTGLGHRDFHVAFDPELSVEEDLGRRDFTINAMARDVATGKLIDPFGGEKDLQEKIIRIVFPKSFVEDPLRMLRAIQFCSRFGFSLENNTREALTASGDLIASVSAERIMMELKKLMTAHKPSDGFRLMKDVGLLKKIFPELQENVGVAQEKRPGDDVFEHTMRALDAARADTMLLSPGDPDLLFAILFHDVGKAKTAKFDPDAQRIVFFGHQLLSARMAKRWLKNMKAETIGLHPERIVHLIRHHMFETKAYFTDRAIRRFVAKIGKDEIFPLLDLRLADNRGGKHPAGIKGVLKLRQRIREELDKKPPFGPKDLKINGHDLMSAGIPAGPLLGKILTNLVDVVLDHPEWNEKEQLLALAAEMRLNLDAHGKSTKASRKSPEARGEG